METVQLLHDERAEATADGYGNERLKLMFACTHPAISPDGQTPLMLQAVLGLDAARIAAAFLVSGMSMGSGSFERSGGPATPASPLSFQNRRSFLGGCLRSCRRSTPHRAPPGTMSLARMLG
jgi:hypothetical protein